MVGLPLHESLDCDRCSLRAGCGQVVWGAGDPAARVMLVGESPGDEEDLMGEPFMSREGVLLTRLLTAAGLDRRACYLTYAVKCMGEAGDGHVKVCGSWLWQELKRVSPRVVVTLGQLPARLLLMKKRSLRLADVAGTFNRVGYMAATVAPWYAPAWLLRHGKTADRQTVEFLTKVRETFVDVDDVEAARGERGRPGGGQAG